MNPPKPYLEDGDLTLYHGDALTVLQGLPAGIAQTCVTSPPYWGLRDYGTGQWSGGDNACDHVAGKARQDNGQRTWDGGVVESGPVYFAGACGRCGARRVDSQLGLEATPALYVANMVRLFREVWRVLRDDGSLWLNLGDSYAQGGSVVQPTSEYEQAKQRKADKGYQGHGGWEGRASRAEGTAAAAGLKPKDLVGIPWRVAFALQADGWYLRSDIIWAKPNPMPESVTDRPTKAHEYLFLFSKQPRYFYDADAIREPHTNPERYDTTETRETWQPRSDGAAKEWNPKTVYANPAGRNRRSVWTIPTQPFPEAHFATYPEELVRPCILAGTSERGECVECGAPWVRETSVDYENPGNRTTNGDRSLERRHETAGFPVRLEKRTETTGWKRSCDHGMTAQPQLVLDPFIGSGTTSLVARKHGRRSIGIDLSTEYLNIAAKRTQQLSLLGTL